MTVFALWSAPRARSTAFFRSMLERGDMICLHEPFSDVTALGETDVQGKPFYSAASLLDWLNDETNGLRVFLKDTPDRRHLELLAGQRLLSEARHAFLIRPPEEIAASFYKVHPDMTIDSIGLESLSRLHAATCDAGAQPIVIDADDLVSRPEATMTAYCAAMGLPFIPDALTWEAGDRPEWRRSARWHADVSASSGFERHQRDYTHNVETSAELARFAAHHRPFYEELHALRVGTASPGAPGPRRG